MESKPVMKQLATKRRGKKKKYFRGNRYTVPQNDGENPAGQDSGENPDSERTGLGENPDSERTELGENPDSERTELQEDEGSTLSSTALSSLLFASASKIDLSFYVTD